MQAQSNVAFDQTTTANKPMAGKGFVRGSLPVRFDVPLTGIEFDFTKSILKSGEANFREIFVSQETESGRCLIKLTPYAAVLLIALLIYRRRRNKLAKNMIKTN